MKSFSFRDKISGSWLTQTISLVLFTLFVALVYALSGTLGLKLAVPPGYATAIFPSSGVALAAILLLGPRILFGIFLGSTAMNLYITLQTAPFSLTTLIMAMTIGLGATIQAFLGYYLITEFSPEYRTLNNERSIISFLFLAGPVSCIANATTSVTTLQLFGVLQTSNYIYNWVIWWVGDAIGVMVFTPLILSIFEPPIFKWSYRKSLTTIPSMLLFSFVIWFFFLNSRQLSERIKSSLQVQAETSASLIQTYIDQYQIFLSDTESFFASSALINPDEFERFVKRSLSQIPGIKAISWNPKIQQKDRKKFEDNIAITEFGANGYSIIPASVRTLYYPIKYVEPIKDNFATLGYDIYSSAVRKVAIENSILTGKPTATEKVRLIQDRENSDSASVLLFFPSFKDEFNPLWKPEEKKRNNTGFVIGIFRIQDIVAAALDENSLSGINYFLFDVSSEKPTQLFRKIDQTETKDFNTPENFEVNRPDEIFMSQTILFGQRKWRFELFPTVQYLTSRADLTAWAVLVGGLVIVILLQSLLMVTTGRTNLVQTLVDQKTNQINKLLIDLRSEKARFELATKGASVAVWEWPDIQEQKIIFSEQAYNLLNYENKEFEATLNSFSNLMHPDDLENTLKLLKQHFADRSAFDIEVRLKIKQGTYRWFRSSGQVQTDSAGKHSRMVGTLQDIHDRKVAELKLAEQAETLKRANEELERFAYVTSHDLQAPLRHIASYTQLLMRKFEPILSPDEKLWSDYIINGVERMKMLISDLLKFSRVGRGNVEFEKVDLNKVIAEIKNTLSEQIVQSHALINTPPLPTIDANKTLITQLFENLISNAIKYRSAERDLKIDIQCNKKDSCWEFSIIDNGIGFEMEFADKIFEVFQRLHRQNEYEGTGIGLSICRKIVQFHGGNIYATSQPGTGSIFTFTIPIRGV